MKVTSEYAPTGLVLVRTPLLSSADFPTSEGPSAPEATREKLKQLLERSEIREAILIASKSLLHGLQRWQAGLESGNLSKQFRQAESSILRYAIRMASRCTPFGTLAGVSLGEVNETHDLHVDHLSIHQTCSTIDAELLWTIVRELEADDGLFEALNLRTNGVELEVGGRAYLDAISLHGKGSEDASLRITPPVRDVLAMCRTATAVGEIIDRLAGKYPDVPRDALRRFVRSLLEQGLLVSDLRPPTMGVNGLDYLIEKLRSITEARHIFEGLRAFQSAVERFDSLPLGQKATTFHELEQLKASLGDNAQAAIKVDLGISLRRRSVAKSVAEDMGLALTLLARQSTFGPSTARMQGYFRAFIERYGAREVPLLEVLKDNVGLGAPQGYQHPMPTEAAPRVNAPNSVVEQRSRDRDTYLLNLLMRNHGSKELELSPEDIARMTLYEDWREHLPDSGELFASVVAESQQAVNEGNYTIVVTPRVRTDRAGKTFGRFHELLGSELEEHLREVYTAEERRSPEHVFAEISYLPYQARTLNVAVKPAVQTYEIPVGVTPSVSPDRVILLTDIVVGARRSGLYLKSRRLDKELKVNATHVVNSFHAPNAVRFLEDVSRDGEQLFYSFNWGAAENLEFLPRLRHGRVILAPRTWNCPANEFPAFRWTMSDEELEAWARSWRSSRGIDRWVQWGSDDNMLVLDLDNPLHVRLLIEDISKRPSNDTVRIYEALPTPEMALDNGNSDRYLQELVVPLRRRLQTEIQATPSAKSLRPVLEEPQVERNLAFGSEWVYLKLYLAATSSTDLLTEFVAPFAKEVDRLESWFFIRYADPRPHVRFRLRFDSSHDAIASMGQIAGWITTLVRSQVVSNVSLDVYEREIERYGGGAGILLSEQLFAADSLAIIEALRDITPDRVEDAVMLRAMLLVDQLLVAAGLSEEERRDLLVSIRSGQSGTFGHRESAVRAFLRQKHESLKTTIRDPAPWLEANTSTSFRRAYQAREKTATVISSALRSLNKDQRLTVTLESVLSSFVHMTCNRLGLDREQEYDVIMALERTYDGLRHYSRKQTVNS